MTPILVILAASLVSAGPQAFDSPKYGLKVQIPEDWSIAAREQDDQVFVAIIPQKDFERPGAVACELGMSPESLEDYRTRIDKSAKRGGRASGKLALNRILKGAGGERLETVWEFHPDSGGFWREISVRLIANRQLYTFILNVEDSTYAQARPLFDQIVSSARFTPPNTGADLLARSSNRWIQREYKFALDLPLGWAPALAPSSVALLFASGEPHGVWSDNLLVLAHARRDLDLEKLVKELPDQLRREAPGCEVVSCKIVPHGESRALETIVKTTRGPFSMTVLERRFRGERFDYEVKYTVESKRFDEALPGFRKSLESFKETPGPIAAPRAGKAA